MTARRLDAGRRHQRGVTTLIVVGVLFFVLSLVAAYTNRSMIFEQRTASNQYRSTLAFEAAEAGVEWALSMLNGGRIDASCIPSTNVADTSLRQRYLTIDPATGVITPNGTLDADGGSDLWPSCVFDGSDWNCSCPAAGAPAVAAPVGTGVFPAFRVRFVRASTTQPGIVQVQVNGCTRLDDQCLDFPSQAVGGEGRATVQSLIALRGGTGGTAGGGGHRAPRRRCLRQPERLQRETLTAAALPSWQAAPPSPYADGQVGSTPGTPGAMSKMPDDPGLVRGCRAGDRLVQQHLLDSAGHLPQPAGPGRSPTAWPPATPPTCGRPPR